MKTLESGVIVECPRVAFRMACKECGYPYSEAAVDTDLRLPHFLSEDDNLINKTIENYLGELKKSPKNSN